MVVGSDKCVEQGTVALQVLVVAVDGIPLLRLLPNLACSMLHLGSLSAPRWPYGVGTSMSLLNLSLSVLLPLSTHLLLVSYYKTATQAWQQHHYDHHIRARLPGNRLDWDVSEHAPTLRLLSVHELVATLAVCVWSVPIWRFLGSCAAAEWSLPTP